MLITPPSFAGCCAQLNRTKIEKTLIGALFKDYDKEGRPVLNLSEPVLVRFGLAYSDLHSLVSTRRFGRTSLYTPFPSRREDVSFFVIC